MCRRTVKSMYRSLLKHGNIIRCVICNRFSSVCTVYLHFNRGVPRGSGGSTASSENSAPCNPPMKFMVKHNNCTCIYTTPQTYVIYQALKSPKLTLKLMKTLQLLGPDLLTNFLSPNPGSVAAIV